MKSRSHLLMLFIIVLCSTACNNETDKNDTAEMKKPLIKDESVTYTSSDSAGSITMNGFVAYDSSSDKKRPVVLIVHEWWGLNEYPKKRARQLAEMGYLAMAVDMYGNGDTADNPEAAGEMAMPFYLNPQMAKSRFDAALARVKSFDIADTNKIAAIGYCFGGTQVLNMARLGESLKGVVSFHGNLSGVPEDKELLKARILICHGEADEFVSAAEVTGFKKNMDSVGASYTFKSYPGATHAFTNPRATEVGLKFKIPIAYNAAADSASWNDMKEFFGKIF